MTLNVHTKKWCPCDCDHWVVRATVNLISNNLVVTQELIN